ncbi:MAG: cytochrome c oxidase accessory protein CcoG [Arenimonas sp.]
MGKSIGLKSLDEGALYVSERKIHPREIDGRFQRLRRLAVFVLLGLFYLAPWLRWDGRQAVLFDLPARKFYVLGLTFWPQDFIFLALLLVMAGLSLFFFTAVAGRLWCGYACPQTVWTEVFVAIEAWCEGDRGARIKLDAAPWTASKWRKRGLRHAAWAVLALWTGFTFVGFFTPIPSLGARTWPFAWSGWETFWVGFYALATWGNAGVLREQVCKYMCPYARFQSAMFDADTLVIAYDTARGEPRGARKRGTEASLSGLGDCIDCTICVQVCPTGIDIRNGLQYECIACGACVDACDSVMDRMGSPRGLVRYTSEAALSGGRRTRLLRPRVLVYAALLLALSGGTGAALALRKPLIVDVLHDKALYRVADDGTVENAYTLRIINKAAVAHTFVVRLESGSPLALATPVVLAAAPEEVLTVPVTVRSTGPVTGGHDVRFIVEDARAGLRLAERARFHGPSR